MKHGLRDDGTPLRGDVACDVAIVGAGITGALVADALSAAGLRVVVLDRHEPASGSTCASTALLQYELDIELVPLMALIGATNAVRAYHLCLQSLAMLEQIALSLGGCGFSSKSSLYLASRRAHGKRLEREAAARAEHGLPARFITGAEVERSYGLSSHGAILSSAAAQVDPVRLTRALLTRACRRGARLVTGTEVRSVDIVPAGVCLHTVRGGRVRATRVVYALGYEVPPQLSREIVTLRSTYALATHRIDALPAWLMHTVLWESARPYAYMRTSDDSRVIIGGEDVPFRNALWRDRLLPSRIDRLEHRLHDLLPGVRCETAFAWAGTFGETADGLPCIGSHSQYPGALFVLGYGGNGITFGAIAARIVCDAVLERPNEDAHLFALERGG